jgi:aquaporin Z
MNTRAYLAELVGTTLFLTLGYASVGAITAASVPTSNLLVVPFAFGLGLLAAVFMFGHVSGGHFNPAVTIAMVLDKRTTPIDAIGYISAQIIGSLIAAVIVMVAVSQKTVADGITKPGTGMTDAGALILETVFTATFLLVILTATKRAPALAALAIPLTLVAIHFADATLSGASVNPARSIGSAVVGGDLTGIWIYIVGPILGGIIGWGIWRGIDGGKEAFEPAIVVGELERTEIAKG